MSDSTAAAPTTDAQEAPTTDSATQAVTQADTAQTQGTDAAASADAQGPEAIRSVDDLPDWAQREIRSARREAANARTKGKTAADEARQSLVDEVSKALGLAPTDEPPSVDDLMAQVTTSRDETRQARVELAVYQAAAPLRVDAAALLDSRSFVATLTDIDPTDSDAVTDAIKTAVANNPRLSAAQAAGASSADRPGQTQVTVTPEAFAAMNYEQRADLYNRDRATYDALVANI